MAIRTRDQECKAIITILETVEMHLKAKRIAAQIELRMELYLTPQQVKEHIRVHLEGHIESIATGNVLKYSLRR